MRRKTLRPGNRRFGTSWSAVAALVAVASWSMWAGCSSEQGSETIETVRGELSGTEMSQVLGMESPALWSSTTAQLSSSAIRVQGNASLAVRATNYNFIDSIPLTKFTLVNNTVSFSIRLPTQQPNPFWFGDVQMFVNAPSVGLVNQYGAYVGLPGRPLHP